MRDFDFVNSSTPLDLYVNCDGSSCTSHNFQSMSNTIMKRTSDPEINNEFNLEFVSIQTQQPYNYDELAMKFCSKSKRTRIQDGSSTVLSLIQLAAEGH